MGEFADESFDRCMDNYESFCDDPYQDNFDGDFEVISPRHYKVDVGGLLQSQSDYRDYLKTLETPETFNGLGECPKCGKLTIKRTGKFGVFYGCSGFPKCKGSREE